jgi:UDP-N-acetyl-D-mannosaminuronate dehydrogenase
MGSSVHILGVSYNRDIDDVRESPAVDIMHLLEKRGAKVSYSDPHVPSVRFDRHKCAGRRLRKERGAGRLRRDCDRS